MTSPREEKYAAMVALLCGELGDAERRELEEFMASDVEASQHFVELSQTFQAVQQIQVPTAPANLADRLLDRLAPEEAEAAEVPDTPVAAEIRMLNGEAKRAARRDAPWRPAMVGDSIHEGEAIELGKNGRALLRLPDTSELWVNAETVLHFGRRASQAFISLVRGEVLALVAKQIQALPIVTPAGTVRVLGTTFDTDVERDGSTRVSVLEGEVEVTNKRGSAKVGGRQRIEVRRGEKPGTAKRMRPAEIDRLTTWTTPIRPASKSAHRVPSRTNEKDNGTMESWWKYLIGIVIVGLIGWGGVSYFGGSEPQIDLSQAEITDTYTPGPDTSSTEAGSETGAAGEVPEGALVFNLDHTVGLVYATTVHVNTDMNVTIPNQPNTNIQQSMTMAMQSEITNVTPESNAHVRTQFQDFQMTMNMNGEEMDLEQVMAQTGNQNLLDAIRGRTFTQTYDRLGNLIDSDYSLFADDPAMAQWSGGQNQDLMQQVMERVGSGVPDGPVLPGAQWTRELHLPGFAGSLATCTSRLARVETIGDQRVAIIQRVINFDNNAPMPPTVVEMQGATITTSYKRMRIRIEVEQQFNVASGRWTGDQGNMMMEMDIDTEVQPPAGPPQSTNVLVQGTARMSTDYDYES